MKRLRLSDEQHELVVELAERWRASLLADRSAARRIEVPDGYLDELEAELMRATELVYALRGRLTRRRRRRLLGLAA